MTKPNVEESTLRKIKKALALATNNPSAQEAETAMLKAQELMLKYGLSMSEVQGVGTAPANATKKEVKYGAGELERNQWYRGSLGKIIGDNFRCHVYLSSFGQGNVKMRFVGLTEDVEIATEVYNYAIKVVEHQAKQYLAKRRRETNKAMGVDFKNFSKEELEDYAIHARDLSIADLIEKYGDNEAIYKMRLIMRIKDDMGATLNPTGIKNDYISGFVKGLKDKFAEQVARNGWGLILVKDALVEQEFKSIQLSKPSPSSAKSSGDSEARREGYKQGKNFNGAPTGGLQAGKQLK